MKHNKKMITLMKGLLLDDWRINEFENNVTVNDITGRTAFLITKDQLTHIKNNILLSKSEQPTKNEYKLMPLMSHN